MHDLHFFLVILRSEKENGSFLSFLKIPIPLLHLASHEARKEADMKFTNTLNKNCSYGIFN